VLEIEADLFGARNAVVESLVHYQVALLDLELIEGSTLQDRRLEITQAELEQATRALARSAKVFNARFPRVVK
jgi:hypothetical protein